MKKAVCIISGGMDSAVVAYIAKNKGYEIIGLHFNYGQRTEKKELECFEKISKALNAKIYVVELPFFSQIGASALIDKNIAVPTDGLKPGVPITYVPFRNGIFLSIAAAVAEKEAAEAIYIGVVEEDSSGYPDCREEFIKSMERSINLGIKEETKIKLKTPLVHLRKEDIVSKAIELGVPLEFTWSCYQAEDEACGVCDSCRLRLKGFKKAGIKDKIPYKISN
ncbi:7-cyano-7-deazaguanine synthase QueC [Nitrosophilus labii]|uniref:7-cyano-7-deazaguanine synthase QueC n=1 Tax=Nitrosophilus labii TaxID=2706014 RepID=UPI001656E36A|nr:7-cyano-7-deazaguanine synthase QueC [Nitrosophilus labii]